MYAIVTTGGKQYRVEQGQSLLVERLPVDGGGKATLRPLLYVDGDNVVDGDGLAKVSVEARVVGHERGPKLRVVKFKPKRGYRRRTGHRQELTRIEVTQIKLAERRPAARRAPRPVAAEAGAAEAGSPAQVETAPEAGSAEAPSRQAKRPPAPAKPARPRASAGDSPAKAPGKPARPRVSGGKTSGDAPAAKPRPRRKPPAKPPKPEEGNGA